MTAANLRTTDAEQFDSELIYSVTSGSVLGTLYRDVDGSDSFSVGDQFLGLGATFTQQDVANGNIQYVHSGVHVPTDSFGFSVTDGTDTVTGQTFSFGIVLADDPSVVTNLDGDVVTYSDVGQLPVALDAGGNVDVTDEDTASYANASLTVSLGASAFARSACGRRSLPPTFTTPITPSCARRTLTSAR